MRKPKWRIKKDFFFRSTLFFFPLNRRLRLLNGYFHGVYIFLFQVLYDNRLVKFSRAYLCLLQGTWLIHAGFIMMVRRCTFQMISTIRPTYTWIFLVESRNFPFSVKSLVQESCFVTMTCHVLPKRAPFSFFSLLVSLLVPLSPSSSNSRISNKKCPVHP